MNMKIMRLGLTAVLLIGFLEAAPATNRYVALSGGHVAPYTNWADAATGIQYAISVCSAGDVVWVTNGTYQVGGVTNWPAGTLLTNRVAITNAITVRSANNDPTNTIIKGAWDNSATTNGPAAVRCVYMANNTALIGFTLTNGATLATGAVDDKYGGGVYAPSTLAVISNCVLSGNAAMSQGGAGRYGAWYNCAFVGNAAEYGGGTVYGSYFNCAFVRNTATYGGATYASTVYSCTLSSNSASVQGGGASGNAALYNCALIGNSTAANGGGVFGCNLYNCTVVGNSAAVQGGGTIYGSSYNSIIYFNTAPAGSNWYGATVFTNSCTTTAAVGWASGNITADPTFISNGSGYGTNHAAGNYRLSANSPCLDAGANFSWMSVPSDARSKDLDGLPRIRNGIVDMGAYEFLRKGTIIYVY